MPQPSNILHLTHTDIRADARILRQLELLRGLPQLVVKAIGVESDEGLAAARAGTHASDIISLRLLTRRMLRMPRQIRYFLNLCELALRMIPKAIAARPRIVHCHDTLVLPIGVMARLFTGCAVIYDAHELESKKSGQTKGLARGTILLERWCWRHIAALVSVSPSILAWYTENLGSKRSVLVLNSPSFLSAADGPVAGHTRPPSGLGYFHERFGIPSGAPVFIYLGYLVRGRGIEGLLEVFRERGFRSHIVFMGTEDEVGVSRHANEYPNIHLHPVVSHDKVVPLVREADCGLCLIEDVSLSDRLCLPNKLFEYAFAGIPVLASRLPEIERVVNQYRLGICCENDVTSIKSAVLGIERAGLAPPPADLSDLSWQAQCERLKDVYLGLLMEHHSRSTRGQ